jgi:hypothetical protein
VGAETKGRIYIMSWYNVRVLGSERVMTLRTLAEDAAQAVANVVSIFPCSMGFWVLDCYTA